MCNYKDLGIYSEMFIDSIIELLELGVIINKKKIFYFGKIVISFVIGIC